MKLIRAFALVAAAMLASISYWQQWPSTLWAWAASLSYDPNWPILLLFWFLCPDPNFLGGSCGNFTAPMILLRVLAVAGIVLATGIVFLLCKAKRFTIRRGQ